MDTKNQPINKTRQKEIMYWLKARRFVAHKWIRLSAMLGLLMTILLILQAGILAWLLHQIIIEKKSPQLFILPLIALFALFALRAIFLVIREQVGQKIGHTVRIHVRKELFNYIDKKGTAVLQDKSAGAWSIIVIEQIDNLNDYYAKFLPQMQLAMSAPISILIAVFWANWAAGLILLFTAPLIPMFMAFVGMGAADANRRNFQVLAQLSGYFLDRLKGLETLRLFHRKEIELRKIAQNSEAFRLRTMEVLRIAFLSSGVLEFFTSVSIAVMAVYFGFSFLGDLNFGQYGLPLTLFVGFFCLLLAPEFYQPLRDLGTFYHAKAQAIGAADALLKLDLPEHTKKRETDQIENPSKMTKNIAKDLSYMNDDVSFNQSNKHGTIPPSEEQTLDDWHRIEFVAVRILSHTGIPLTQPISFVLNRGDKVILSGKSGAGKTSLIHCIMGFLPFEGQIIVDGIPIHKETISLFRRNIHWLSQNPVLPANTIRENLNIVVSEPKADTQLWDALKAAKADEFVKKMPQGLDTAIGENAVRMSVGQAQRIALAKLFVSDRSFWILDEPTASLDKKNADAIMLSILTAVGFNIEKKSCAEIANQPYDDITLLLISHDEEIIKLFPKKIELVAPK